MLHAHLPDCRRPEIGDSLEEIWFFEVMAGCYLPLCAMLESLACDGVDASLTLSLSPPLLCMLGDGSLLDRFRAHVTSCEHLADRDARAGDPSIREAAATQRDVFTRARHACESGAAADLVGRFRRLHDAGTIELATTAASHAFLPALQSAPDAVRAQIAVGIDVFTRATGVRPRFFWLPECGWFPGVDAMLREHDVVATIVEERSPPVSRTKSGLHVLARDGALSRLVWSASDGYPGAPEYREFHRSAAASPQLKYWRVTGSVYPKEPYDPAAAARRMRADAEHFVRRLEHSRRERNTIVLPFDAELFGHWWFEGVAWLEHVLRLTAASKHVRCSSVDAALAPHGDVPEGEPASGSWGREGTNAYWINHDNAWVLPQLAVRRDRLQAALALGTRGATRERALQRAAQILLLAEASDWPFMISGGALRGLAEARLADLFGACDRLLAALEAGDAPEPALVAECERLFPAYGTIDLTRFSRDRST
ncbi:1,4-alpha-glucan branching protein domain-containing protein [Congregicoccus parvus]|uniref:1,4-alpha-glucan branching protein domain-containing protein n=1 Tax=Congregicoccus parvus TaxID=3081749 RepID=UPI003FA569EB